MSKKIVIVGGVAGGASAAARLRRLDEEAEIILFERGPYVSFANCGLPYHIGEVIPERDSLLVTTKEMLWNRFRIDVRVESEVRALDHGARKVSVASKERGSYEESFDELILSPGAMPMKPPIPGIDLPLVKSLRNVPDTDEIKALVDGGAKSAVVIGGGFIGVEVAENLKHRGLKVTLIEAAPHILAPLDTEMSMIVEKEMRTHGVELILNDGVAKFEEIPGGVRTTTAAGVVREADLVVAAIGVRPDTAFLKESGLELNQKGYIVVDEAMKTNLDHVWAAGDAVQTKDYNTGEAASIALAGPANRQGRMIADNIAGLKSTYPGSQGTSILKAFDMVAGSTGRNERQLLKSGEAYKAFYAHPQSHAAYYPGAQQMVIKILTDSEGKLLGAQAVGYAGIDKVIDVLATVMHFRGGVEDLVNLDLAYAPPFLSAKSPANMVGFVAQNHFDGLVEEVTFTDYDKSFDSAQDFLLDVRSQLEADNGTLEGAKVVPVDELRDRLDEVPRDKKIWVYCQIGLRGYIASRILKQHGYEVVNLTGGYRLLSLGKVSESETGPGDNGGKEIPKVAPEPTPVAAGNLVQLNACGLACPGPLMQTKQAMDDLNEGDVLEVQASDPGFYEDVQAFARRTGGEILALEKSKGLVKASLRKRAPQAPQLVSEPSSKNKTLVVFSGDLDKAIASFIIANGAAALGGKVTMFFTFWGINILRKETAQKVNKNFLERMFSSMMPRGSKKLGLSKMNMAGMGPAMIKKVIKNKHVDSLEELMAQAQANGVELVACQMSMDLLGLKHEELMDGVKLGGVGYYLGNAEEAGVNLFI